LPFDVDVYYICYLRGSSIAIEARFLAFPRAFVNPRSFKPRLSLSSGPLMHRAESCIRFLHSASRVTYSRAVTNKEKWPAKAARSLSRGTHPAGTHPRAEFMLTLPPAVPRSGSFSFRCNPRSLSSDKGIWRTH